jgi:formylglycine-generating enzyme required for sulfatase activity
MTMTRRRFLLRGTALLPVAAGWRLARGGPPENVLLDTSRDILPAPDDPAQWPAFRAALAAWRARVRSQLHYDDVLYRRPEFAWAASNYSCCFIMLCDETFCDSQAGQFAVEEFLERGRRDFGGYDSVVLWQAYPRIGLDQRNQFDFYRDQPGGLPGLRSVVRRFHRQGVKVYIDYNPWDTGTRREEEADIVALAGIVRAIEADGLFLDTLNKPGADFRRQLDAARPGVILESEDAVPLENIREQHASWAQWFQDSRAPGVLKQKWFEPRHMQHGIRRWDHDHSAELQTAWMNGSGMLVWENVFGTWMPWNELDRSILRAMLPIQRRYTRLFQEGGWTPLIPVAQPGVFASLWQDGGLRLWTLVNRAESERAGVFLKVRTDDKERCFDLVAGAETANDLAGAIPPRGIGCFVCGAERDLGPGFARFLRRQSKLNSRKNFNTDRPGVQMRARPRVCAPQPRALAGMVQIPAASLELSIDMRVRECGFYDSTLPPQGLGDYYNFRLRNFRRPVEFKPFSMDETPVTNGQYALFLRRSGYRPRHPENFLKHWPGREDHPVVYVDPDDARAYAQWAGKRLPTEEEWQYAAQGTDGRKFPWGKQMETGRCNDGSTGATTPVKAFPRGRSPFGCYDMCGNVWEWTDSERSDGRTRFCIIRGGSFYQAQGSGWYADGGPRPVDFAEKFLLAWPGLDRCGTIGFRCAADNTG